jgi:hypothetical protein
MPLHHGPPSTPDGSFKPHFQFSIFTMAELPLYIPDWLETELHSLDPYPMIHERIEVKNWLTEGLIDEIQEAFLLLMTLR